MKSFFDKWRSISSNAVFGAAKSFLAYIFVVVLYKYSSNKDLIKLYIDYEVWAAASVLFTFGIQGHAYKTLRSDLLGVLSIFFLLVSVLLFFLNVFIIDVNNSLLLIMNLVVTDRALDVLLQVERQSNRFDIYNWNDIFNSLLVKAGFLLAAADANCWVAVLLLKLSFIFFFAIRHSVFSRLSSGVVELKKYFFSFRRFIEWYAFDVLNFSVMNLDLVVVRVLGQEGLVELYFYVRKFVRLPLVLLNYVIDPLYVNVRKVEGVVAAHKKLVGYMMPIYWASNLLLVLLGVFLFAQFDSAGQSIFGFCVAITSYVLVITRLGDLYVLLFYSQRHRLLMRILCLSGVAVLPASALVSDGMLYGLLIYPLLGWMFASRFVFSVPIKTFVGHFAAIGLSMALLLIMQHFDLGGSVSVMLLLSLSVCVSAISAHFLFKSFVRVFESKSMSGKS